MSSAAPRPQLRLRYAKWAEEYLRSLPPEHFMEATPQGTQRAITLASLALVQGRRPEVQFFNELLVQYERPGTDKPGQVVPDNMIVIHPRTLHPFGSYDVPCEPARPFCMLEYVSKGSARKDYDDNMEKYEHELKVPYYLLFHPDNQDLSLYRHNKRKYVSVKPNANGRLAIPDLELEVAILDGWVRFWFRGELLPLPAELQRELDKMRQELEKACQERDQVRQERDQARHAQSVLEDEVAQLRARLAQLEKEPRPRKNG
jgi:hypothetical protein